MHVILHVILCNVVCNESCNAVCNESCYLAYYMPLHKILHACYMTLKSLEVHHVMACKLHVITCNYMHYMPLHAMEDANQVKSTISYNTNVTYYDMTYDIIGFC